MYRYRLQQLLLSFVIAIIPVTVTGAETLMPVYQLLLLSGIDTNQKVFIIGDSTVHRHVTDNLINGAGMTCGDDNPEGTQRGWGDDLNIYMAHPANTTNKARQGASSVDFQEPPDDAALGIDRNWQSTETLLQEAGGGFLLIQFGSGNENHHTPRCDGLCVDNDDDGNIDNRIDYNNDGVGNADDEAPRLVLREARFTGALEFYITRARELNVVPILVTPPEGRLDEPGELADGTHPDTRHPFPGYIHAIGAANGVEVLDLQSKSNEEFSKYSDAKLLEEFGDCSYNSGRVDRVHYEPQGSVKVAGWVKELACTELNDKSFCAQFSTSNDKVIPSISLIGDYYIALAPGEAFLDPGATALDDVDGNITAAITVNGVVNTDEAGVYPITYDVIDSSNNAAIQVTRIVEVTSGITIREDAEDGDIENWIVYTGEGTINNVFDADRQSRVIQLDGPDGTDDGFRYNVIWDETSETVVSWSMKYSEDFTFFISAQTADGARIFVYQPTDNGQEITHNGARYRFSLGTDATDGTWRTFTRDLIADMKVLDPDNELQSITRIAIRGSGLVDDITSATRGNHANFSYDGHTYQIVKTALSWQQASDAAQVAGGYLANIGSIAENHEIYSRLNRHVAEGEYQDTVASNGGGASYVWIGANDLETEDTWIWENNNTQFWNGPVAGNAVGALYNNWGRNVAQEQHEPDDAGNQDAAAMALTEWQLGSGNLGQTSQWNDLKAADALFYIIEFED